MPTRALSRRPIFSGLLLLHHLDDGRSVITGAKLLHGVVTAHEELIVRCFVETEAVEFIGASGRSECGRDAEHVLVVARRFVREAFVGESGPLGTVAVDLAIELGPQRWRQAS